MLKDLAVGPFVLDFTNSAFDEKPAGGSTFARLVASITVLPSKPCTLSRASAIAPPGTATTTASTFETSPPSRPILVTSWPSLSQALRPSLHSFLASVATIKAPNFREDPFLDDSGNRGPCAF